jgi:aerobic-type carbon monoxide dehydrogenase small subunit (CoxS/CutS family)
MQVEISIKVNGQTVKSHVAEVGGTLEEMEEVTHALGKKVACDALQATVDVGAGPRPLFRKRAESCVTKAIKAAVSLVSTGR